jgi:allantoicase
MMSTIQTLHNNDEQTEQHDVKQDEVTTTTTTTIPTPSIETMMIRPTTTTTTTTTTTDNMINGCSMQHGAKILFVTDEWFATADHLLLDIQPQFDPTLYCSQGKVMDGWETRRKRQIGHDFCIIQLSYRIQIQCIQIDTAYFTGNQTPYISIMGIDLKNNMDDETNFIASLPNATKRLLVQMKRQQHYQQHQQQQQEQQEQQQLLYIDEYQGTCSTSQEIQIAEDVWNQYEWHLILPLTELQPGYESTRFHEYVIDNNHKLATTHIRFNYYPDGGVARLRIFGIPILDNDNTDPVYSIIPKQSLFMPITTCDTCTVISYDDIEQVNQYIDNHMNTDNHRNNEVSNIANGGIGLYCTNQHYGTPNQLVQSSTGIDMSDGWETSRQKLRPKILQPIIPNVDHNNNNKNQTTPTLVDFGTLLEYCILQLGYPIQNVQRIVIDTKHFKGNAPESIDIYGCDCTKNDTQQVLDHEQIINTIEWFPLLHRCLVSPHAIHIYEMNLGQIIPIPEVNVRGVTHVRVRIYPDGGLSRVRIYGQPLQQIP